MSTSYRILYIQHAGALGGSCMSLLYLLQELDRSQYEPVVACIHDTPAVVSLYREHGFETLVWPGISDFPHTTLGWYPLYNLLAVVELLRRIVRFWPSVRATEALVRHVQPDIVHLNSLVLAPSAVGVKRVGVPLVWHVREPVHGGHLGLRRRFLSWLFMRLADEAIFISHFDRQQLTGGRKGVVVHNFVDFQRFDRTLDGGAVRAEWGLRAGDKVVLFLGGISQVKGIFPLLRALHLAKQCIPQLHCVIGAGKYQSSNTLLARTARAVLSRIGSGTSSQRVVALMQRYGMWDYVHLLPFRTDVERLIATSDLVVFPSIEPHFARPVIEAGAMAKPVVASRIGGVEELVVDSETGLLVPPGDAAALAQAMVSVLRDADLARRLGEAGYQQTRERFDAKRNVGQVIEVYERVLLLGSNSVTVTVP